MDVSIQPGVDFVDVIRSAIRSSGAVLAIIGPDWVRKRVASATSDDYVVFEVATAFEHRKLVIPVLVEGATMPSREDLPGPIKSLARIEALEISDERWDYDLGRLCSRLEEVLPEGSRHERANDRGAGAEGRDESRRRFGSTKKLALAATVLIALVAAGSVATILSRGDGDSSNGGLPSSGAREPRLGDRVLSSRMRGEDVRELQVLLQRLGFNAGVADGEFSSQTGRAVVAFKTCWGEGLQPDTRVDQDVVAALQTHGIVTGTDGNDGDLVGTPRSDIIFGLNGNDTIEGLGGDDKLCAGEGEDAVSGGVGDDRLYGGADADRLAGGDGADTLIGFKGDDSLDGGDGTDVCPSDAGDRATACER